MGPGTASRFRAVLELVGGLTLVTALDMSMLMQVRVWRAVRSDSDDDEHDDFKIRTEQRSGGEAGEEGAVSVGPSTCPGYGKENRERDDDSQSIGPSLQYFAFECIFSVTTTTFI
jgi:hypothetical protein